VTDKLNTERWYNSFDGLASIGEGDRLNAFGSIGLMSSAAGTAVTGDVFGVLYLEAEIEFKEFDPVSVTRPALHEAIRSALTADQSSRMEARSLSGSKLNQTCLSDCVKGTSFRSPRRDMTRKEKKGVCIVCESICQGWMCEECNQAYCQPDSDVIGPPKGNAKESDSDLTGRLVALLQCEGSLPPGNLAKSEVKMLLQTLLLSSQDSLSQGEVKKEGS
jgi:hypothetical protein